jgi:hypothetical protein
MDDSNRNINLQESKNLDASLEVIEKAKWLSQTIDAGLIEARKKKNKLKLMASFVKLSTLFLSGTVTILLGIQLEGWEDKFKMVAFIFGTFVTILNAVEPFFNFRSLWVEHEEVVYRLNRLKDNLNFYLSGKQSHEILIDELEKFNKKYEQIWDDVSQKWLALRRSEDIKKMHNNHLQGIL